jgi:uncharacterized coiled-coil DUF342 family protein
MINEFFLQSAVNIRRQYLKISNNMELYHNKAKEVVDTLESSVKKLEEIQEKVKTDSSMSAEKSISHILKVINDVEQEGKRLEELVDPMNKEIEKLSKEENELYRKIKEKHPDLLDEQIVKSVEDRLQKEGLL